MKLYVYCLAEGVDELPNPLAGIAGAPVCLLKLDKFSLLVSDFAGDAVPVNRENALAHAAVVQSVLERTTPLPFRFGTLVTEQQLQGYVSARRHALESKLGSIHGCVEMSVKIISDRKWTDEPVHADQTQDKPGTAFLSQKRREILGSEARTKEAKRIAAWLEDEIREVVRETQVETNPTDKLILAGAHLVERSRVQQYRTRLTGVRQQRPELHFLVSGPWAPYSFTNMDLEFKTQFGVS
jgi:hypothetical protein